MNAPAAERVLAIVQQFVHDTHPDQTVQISLNSHLERDLALDSLSRAELMQRIGKEFDMALPEEALAEVETPRDVLRFLDRLPQQRTQTQAAGLPAAQGAGIPDGASTLIEVLEWHAGHQPDRVHILLQDDKSEAGELALCYLDLLDGARRIAAGLIGHGLLPGQTVALMLPTGRDYLQSFFGVMLAGGIAVPIYPPARMAQLEDHLKRHARILANAQASRIITVDQARPVAVQLQAAVPGLDTILTPMALEASGQETSVDPARAYRPRPDDIAFLQYTSGSTGDPKGVILTHANLLANVRALGKATQVRKDDVFVSWLPLYHDMGLIGAWFGSLYHGIPLVLMSPLSFLARPVRWLQAITRHRGTISGAPNFAYELCVRHISDASLASLDLSSWRIAFNGAEPVSPSTLETFTKRFAPCGLRCEALSPVYGLAESSVGLAFPPPGRGPRIDSVLRTPFERDGKAIPATATDTDVLPVPACGPALLGHEMRVVDEAGIELPERRVGRLEFRGPSATSGYYRNPEATAKLFQGEWLDTGDYAYLAEGEVHITGRVKDLIKRGGRNLYPYDLEEAVGKMSGIRRGCVAVFASRDPAAGTERLVVMAETKERDPVQLAALRDRVNQTAIDVIGTPADDIVLVPPHSVLKTSSGKIRRIASREAYEHGKANVSPTAPWVHAARLITHAALARLRIAARHAGARLYGIYAWSVFGLLLVPFGALMTLVRNPGAGRRIARGGTRLLFRLAGVRLAAIGLERLPAQPHILLVNHASYLDGIALTALLPASHGYAFVAKQELATQRIPRRILNALGTVFIERADVRRSTADVDRMCAVLQRGDNLLVFPEGTFDRQPGLKPFHTGAFLAATKAGVPVVVAGLRGTRLAFRDGTRMPHRTNIAFDVGATLQPSGNDWIAAMQLRAAARQAMLPLSGESGVLKSDAISAPLDLHQSI